MKPVSVAQSNARPTGDQEVAGLIFLPWTDNEIFSTVIFSLLLIQEGSCHVHKYWLTV